MSHTPAPPSLTALKRQRSHLLLVLAQPKEGSADDFAAWHAAACRETMLKRPEVLTASYFVEDDVDITGGKFPALTYRHLAIYELSVDGAEQAEAAIAVVEALHRDSGVAEQPATWLYFPVGEKVGLSVPEAPFLTIAYSNGTPGDEDVFREWYTTRHIRHALNIPAFTSGQCFERTQWQRAGALEARFHIIALYEQTGSSQELITAFKTLSPETISFPTMDHTRFSEAAYRRIA
jgi:hypothetical protein